jgi:flagellar biosynthesis protein FlhF
MRLKTFNAPTMAEAMRLVRDELGDDAIIVSSHRSRRGRGVQLTAAIEPRDLDAPAATNGTAAREPSLDDQSGLHQALSYHGVPARLADRLARAAAAADTTDPERALAAALESYIDFDAARLPPATGALMLVGPPGAGKTTTTAKLATRAALAGQGVAVCTTDTVRAGAVAQIEAVAEVLQQPLLTAEAPKHLGVILQQFEAAGHAVLVDSAGCNPHDPEELEDLRRFVKAGKVEPILVLPAGGDAEEMADTALAYARLGCRRMIVARLDAARRYGSLLGAAAAGKLAFAAAGISPSIPHGLKDLSPLALARVLLRDPTRPIPPCETGVAPHER